ncbi:GNAT family N-acetyltransferase [Halopenitus sp. POP-27]|uniref:GNAT family N-acetyltransferase n=1 Tax=Halopenitus sp. POP-27 TaxID=2994425 RepID=UPI0024691738|nr:GNAT family N-acetyltransferase [Halopenitus sp. POP-27]
MEFELLGWPDADPTLRLDYRAFSYAGKFATSGTGVAVLREDRPDAVAPGWEPDPSQPDPAPRPDADGDTATLADDVVAAVAFNRDRTDPSTLWIRYVSVHTARRGEGLGPRLVADLVRCVRDRESTDGGTGDGRTDTIDRIRIGVNNPFAYEALYKVGFAFTGRETGVAELVLERPIDAPADRDRETYRAGLDVYRDRDRGEPEASFLDERVDGEGPPPLVEGAF